MPLFGLPFNQRTERKIEYLELRDFNKARYSFSLAKDILLRINRAIEKNRTSDLQDRIRNAHDSIVAGRRKLHDAQKHEKKLVRLCTKLERNLENIHKHEFGGAKEAGTHITEEEKAVLNYVKAISAETAKADSQIVYIANFLRRWQSAVITHSRKISIDEVDRVSKEALTLESLCFNMIFQLQSLFRLEREINHYLRQIKA